MGQNAIWGSGEKTKNIQDLRAELSTRGERGSRRRSKSLPNPSPDLFRVAAWFGGEEGKSPSVECDGDVDRQCGFIL